MRFWRSVIAVWLLVAFGACYATPAVLTAGVRPSNCCHRDGHGACCRKTHAEGSFWAASAACGESCRLPAGLSGHISPLVAPRAAAVHVAAPNAKLHAQPATRSGGASYFAFLYQRPPPSGF